MHILIAPLDWGLGHTTRSVPLIKHLQHCGHKVSVAGNDVQLSYFAGVFPDINKLELKGYNVRYANSGGAFMVKLFRQLPEIYKTVIYEHEWLDRVVKEQGIDAVISDNRYGMYHEQIPSVVMTHQLQPISGMGAVADSITAKLHRRFLSKFNECWLVDDEQGNIAGVLSKPKTLPPNTKYIGLLSQVAHTGVAQDGSLMVLLSGPEPQRTILSDKLWQAVKQYKGKVTFVEGSNKIEPRKDIPDHIDYYLRVNGDVLQVLIEKADTVVCRSGYSTVMDLLKLGKKAILIPTPGQTEQEYLGKLLHERGLFYHMPQSKIDLEKVLQATRNFPFNGQQLNFEQYKTVLDEWLMKL